MTATRPSRGARVATTMVVCCAMGLSTTVSAAAPTDPVPSPASETSAPPAAGEGGRRSNTLGAVAGFSLLAGWLLVGFLQFRRGRRRLAEARASTDADGSKTPPVPRENATPSDESTLAASPEPKAPT